jgi:two-component system NtrC family response regulator
MMSKKLLVVEDDPKSLYALKSVLQDRGYQVVACDSAEQVASMDHQHYHAAIIDVRLPGASGTDLALQLRQNHAPGRIIFVTAYNGIKGIQEGFPGSAVLVKPLDMDALLRLL